MIYLASRSKRRCELLKQAKILFQMVPSYFEEQIIPKNPVLTVMVNALGKAAFVKIRPKQGILVGADTIVCLKDNILGKPKNKRDALKMLFSLSGTEHSVYTGVALFNFTSKKWKQFCVVSKVKMKKFSKKDTARYLSKINPLDKAGAYAIQEHGDHLIQKIKGSYTNVVGLPMEKLKQSLRGMK